LVLPPLDRTNVLPPVEQAKEAFVRQHPEYGYR
jgi:hypothetical protein